MASEPSSSTPLKRSKDEAELSDLSSELENKIPALFSTPPDTDSQEAKQTKCKKLEIPSDTPEWAKSILTQFWDRFEEIEKSVEYEGQQAEEALLNSTNLGYSFASLTKEVAAIENKMQTKIDILEEENRQLNTKLLKLESYSRRDNLLIFGVPEENGETRFDCLYKVKCIFYDIGVEYPDGLSIIRCHRKGPPKINSNTGRFYGAPRPIIVRFQWPEDRSYVWEARTYLRGSSYYFADDLPEPIEKNRKTLWPAYKKAKALKSKYRKVEMVEDRLCIDGKTYTIQNMNTLPKDINPASKAEKSNENTTAFFGKQSPLSNHHPATFTLEGSKYNCTEQYLMREKALMCKDEITAHKIMAAKDPVEQKHLGRDIEKHPQYNERIWQKNAPWIMEKALRAKFEQNATLKKWLLDTQTKTLVEASSDKFWGVGISIHDRKILDQQAWEGQNVLGKALMKIRTILTPKR